MGPFRGEAHVDLSNLRGIIALCGENGTGKSTFLECYAAALRRKLPTCGKGTLASIASGRDSYVEARVTNGSTYTIRQMVDAVSGKGESMVTENGLPLLESAKVRDYDCWAAKHLPAEDVFFASLFSAQKSEGFLEMGETERQATLLRTLGVERWEAMAEKCRKLAASSSSKLAIVVTRIRDEEGRGGSVETAGPALEAAKEAADRCACDLDIARTAATLAADALAETQAELATLQANADAVAREIGEHERMAAECNARREDIKVRAEAAKAEATAKLKDARAKVLDIEARLANNKKLLDDAETIKEAVAKDAELAAAIEALTSQSSALKADASRWAEREAAARKAHGAALARHTAESNRAMAMCTRLDADERAVRDAQDQLPELKAAEFDAATAVELRRASVTEAEDAAAVTTEDRITVLRGALCVIAIGALDPFDDPSSVASRAIASDDVKIDLQKEAPARVKAARAELRAADIARQAAADALADAKRRAAGADRLDALRSDLEAAEASRDSAELEAAENDGAAKEAATNAAGHRAQLADAQEAMRATLEARSALSGLAAKAERLTVAHERIDAYEEQLRTLRDTIAETEEASPLSEPPEAMRAAEEAAEHLRRAMVAKSCRVDLLEGLDIARGKASKQTTEKATANQAVADAEYLDRSAHTSLALAQQALDRAKMTERTLGALLIERKGIEEELADWNLLAESLGVDGLQALEVDGAAGELTAIVNDLLHSCFGSRWTVSLETTRSSADGKKQIETCRVTVLDNEQAIPPEKFKASGGQAVIINEAISLALSMLACRRSGAHGVTLVRDESGAALDPENAKAYVAMLRRAADHVGAKNVLLVSHSTAVQDLADARILVKGGKLEVVS